jgi:hypothetical protein
MLTYVRAQASGIERKMSTLPGTDMTMIVHVLRKSSPHKGESQWETCLTMKPR